jgi:2-octaprenylphenol hydroxylase
MHHAESVYDVIVVGGGIVGATTALAMAQQTDLKIGLLDTKNLVANWQHDQYGSRVSAISLASQRIFQRLGIWDVLQAARVSHYQKMLVWDANSDGKIQFDCHPLQLPALGFIIEDELIRQSLYAALHKQKNIHLLAPLKVLSLQKTPAHILLETEQQGLLQASLVVGADGGDSWVRKAAQIDLKNRPYEHEAIVATVKTAYPHAATARQRFLTSGPLAFLPLAEAHTSSIVWSTSANEAASLMLLSDAEFQHELSAAFGFELGEVTAVGARQRFALQMRHAKNYVQAGIALVGDAAHTLHPLAGQGVNLGLLDAVCLAEVVADAVGKQRNFASLATLRRYERWRKGDNIAMLAFVKVLKQLFGSELKTLKRLRSFGLNMTDQLDFAKHFFVETAAGNRGDLPKLARPAD